MRVRCVKCVAVAWFGVMSVSGIGAKPPELPARPLVEFKVPLFPQGDQSPEPPLAEPVAPSQPTPEQLEVMPREIESLDVMPRPAPEPTPRKVTLVFPNRDPEVPCPVWELMGLEFDLLLPASRH